MLSLRLRRGSLVSERTFFRESRVDKQGDSCAKQLVVDKVSLALRAQGMEDRAETPALEAKPETASGAAIGSPAASSSPSDPEPIRCMVCSVCAAPIASADELLCEAVLCAEASCWKYELDFLESTAWCYSATNSGDNRFDVARFGVGAVGRVATHGTPTDEHTWFPPHRWSMAACRGCDQHLGWAFSDGLSIDDGTFSFVGLVLTRLRETSLTPAQLNAPPSAGPPAERAMAALEHGSRLAQLLVQLRDFGGLDDGLPVRANDHDEIDSSSNSDDEVASSQPPLVSAAERPERRAGTQVPPALAQPGPQQRAPHVPGPEALAQIQSMSQIQVALEAMQGADPFSAPPDMSMFFRS